MRRRLLSVLLVVAGLLAMSGYALGPAYVSMELVLRASFTGPGAVESVTYTVDGAQVTKVSVIVEGDTVEKQYPLTDPDAYQTALDKALKTRDWPWDPFCYDGPRVSIEAQDDKGRTRSTGSVSGCKDAIDELLDELRPAE